MTDQKKWVTVADAQTLAKRSRSTLYRILAGGGVRTVEGTDGVLRLRVEDLMRELAKRRPGRPRGTASHTVKKARSE